MVGPVAPKQRQKQRPAPDERRFDGSRAGGMAAVTPPMANATVVQQLRDAFKPGSLAGARKAENVSSGGVSKKKNKATKRKPRAVMLVSDLPDSLGSIYQDTLRHMLPGIANAIERRQSARSSNEAPAAGDAAVSKDKSVSKNTTLRPFVIEEVGGATLAVSVPSRELAKQVFSRLQNARVFGRRWKVEFVPKSSTVCSPLPAVVDVRLSTPLTLGHVHHVLSSLPGFLTVFEELDTDAITGQSTVHQTVTTASSTIREEESELSAPSFLKFVATFTDEGSALHARAVVSGRQHEGAHFFITRRPIVPV